MKRYEAPKAEILKIEEEVMFGIFGFESIVTEPGGIEEGEEL